jgi:hypothetical protein
VDDDAFRNAFEAGRLEAFHHRDHVRLAWVYLRDAPGPAGLERFVTGLQRFAAAAGKPGLYHETITWAFLLIVRERMARTPAASFADFSAANPDLLAWNPSILDRYYRPETLASDLARRVFVMPDRWLEAAAVALG